jgi:RND family efflux transporter MFP subunit
MLPSSSSTRRALRSLIVPLAVLMSVCLQLVGCGAKTEMGGKSKPDEAARIEADVIRVEPLIWPRIVRSQGSLVADEVAIVGAKVAGRVDEVHVDLGDYVEANRPLVTLDQSEFHLQVVQAEAQLAQARSAVGLKPEDRMEDLDPLNSPPVREAEAQWVEAKANLGRAKALVAREAVTPAEYEEMVAAEGVAQARYASALNAVREKIALIGVREAELNLALQRLEDAVIRMPFDGLVHQRDTAKGGYIKLGDPVATVVRTNPLRFRGTLPERFAQRVAIGQDVSLKIESIEQPVNVKITRISPGLNRLNRSLLFEANVKNPDRRLRAGLFGEADVVISPQATAIVVPESAVVEFAGAEKVWKVVDGKSVEQAVLTGERRDAGIEVFEGLNPGDVILVNGSQGKVAAVTANSVANPVEIRLAQDAQKPASPENGSVLPGAGTVKDGLDAIESTNSE